MQEVPPLQDSLEARVARYRIVSRLMFRSTMSPSRSASPLSIPSRALLNSLGQMSIWARLRAVCTRERLDSRSCTIRRTPRDGSGLRNPARDGYPIGARLLLTGL